MCTTCGCSADARPRVTDLKTGEVVVLEEGKQEHHDAFGHLEPHAHWHEQPRGHGDDQAGGHCHDHSYEHEPGVADYHTNSHQHYPDHGHGYRQSHDIPGAAPRGSAIGIPGALVSPEPRLLAKNDELAERNRGWFARRSIFALNLMSSPGAGKTSLLERLLRDLCGEVPMSVIEGDQETLNDAERIRETGCRVVQINTGTGCYLDAEMLAGGLSQLAPEAGSVVLIENVGNLVCPALFDLGEACKVVIMSVTEGEDKPLKYPHMFRASRLMILNKIDLLPYVSFDVERCLAAARSVNPELEVLLVSATRGDGLESLYDWLRTRRASLERRPGAELVARFDGVEEPTRPGSVRAELPSRQRAASRPGASRTS
jgi:hydrogenase nickel incorporation protein HypB